MEIIHWIIVLLIVILLEFIRIKFIPKFVKFVREINIRGNFK